MDVEFDADCCAKLHNELLARTYQSDPNAAQYFKADMIERIHVDLPAEYTEFLNMEDPRFHRFFSQINTYHPPGRVPYKDMPLSGEYSQPNPYLFYYTWLGIQTRHILLYSETPLRVHPELRLAPCFGLVLDLETWMVAWVCLDGGSVLPDEDEAWVPLEVALRKSLEMWDRGQYYWSGHPSERDSLLRARSWTTHDLEEAVSAWEALLEAIHQRMPTGAPTTLKLKDPLPAELVDEYEIAFFAKGFLKAAKRPPFTFVAPGLTTFTDKPFSTIMNDQDPQFPTMSMVFPAAFSVQNIPKTPRPPENVPLDQPDGRGEVVVAVSTGLYTNPWQPTVDCAVLVTAESRRQPGTRGIELPWGNIRDLTFTEMFNQWTKYVKDGVWEINEDGVSTPHSWFTDPDTRDQRMPHWSMKYR